jgi:hypothetical protein
VAHAHAPSIAHSDPIAIAIHAARPGSRRHAARHARVAPPDVAVGTGSACDRRGAIGGSVPQSAG